MIPHADHSHSSLHFSMYILTWIHSCMSLTLVTLTTVDVVKKSLRCTGAIDSCVLILCDCTCALTYISVVCVRKENGILFFLARMRTLTRTQQVCQLLENVWCFSSWRQIPHAYFKSINPLLFRLCHTIEEFVSIVVKYKVHQGKIRIILKVIHTWSSNILFVWCWQLIKNLSKKKKKIVNENYVVSIWLFVGLSAIPTFFESLVLENPKARKRKKVRSGQT